MLTREQFMALPIPEQLWEVYQEQTTEKETPRAATPAPRGSSSRLAPKYDGQLKRKGGMAVWMSELALPDLHYWYDRNLTSTDEKYRESNQKTAKVLGYWVAYREAAPDERWKGLRGDQVIEALPPSDTPEEHVWVKREERAPAVVAPSGPAFGSSEYTGSPDDDPIPF